MADGHSCATVERKKHKDAFELYFAMGASRSLSRLSKLTGVNHRTIEDWSQAFKWQERIKEREALIDDMIKKDQDYVIKQTNLRIMGLVRKTIDKAMDVDKDGITVKKSKLECRDVDDLQKLVKTHQLISGGPTERSENGGKDGGPLQVEFV